MVAAVACCSRSADASTGFEHAAVVVAAAAAVVAGDVDKSCHYSTAVVVEKRTATCAPAREATLESCYDVHGPPNVRSKEEEMR